MRLVPGDDGPSIAVRERERVHTLRQIGDLVAHRAGPYVSAELTEHEETLRREDVRHAIGRALPVVVEEPVVEPFGVDASRASSIGLGFTAEHGRQGGPPVPGTVARHCEIRFDLVGEPEALRHGRVVLCAEARRDTARALVAADLRHPCWPADPRRDRRHQPPEPLVGKVVRVMRDGR